MPCGWEGNRRSGFALAMRHRHLSIRAHGLRKGDEHPPGVWHSFTFTFISDTMRCVTLRCGAPYCVVFAATCCNIPQCTATCRMPHNFLRRTTRATPHGTARHRNATHPMCANLKTETDVNLTTVETAMKTGNSSHIVLKAVEEL